MFSKTVHMCVSSGLGATSLLCLGKCEPSRYPHSKGQQAARGRTWQGRRDTW